MKKIVLSILGLISSISVVAVPTPEVVASFYQSMQDMSLASSDSEAVNYRNGIMDCFKGKSDGGIPVPNDFYSWGYTAEKHITANTYSTRFYDLSFKKRTIRMSDYTIEKSKYISEVELQKFKKQNSGLIQTIVKKTFSDGKVTKTFSDTLIVEAGKIVIFRNSLFNEAEDVDIEALRVLAASQYSAKQYYRAYKTYEKILKHDPDNANAYYRLALLTYWRQGCDYSKREAHRKGLEYAKTAMKLGYYNASTAIYYMEHKQTI